jgi:hypothetical protein
MVVTRQVCDALAQDPQIEQCPVQSNVAAGILQPFVSTVQEEVVKLTTFCDEFLFRILSRRVEIWKHCKKVIQAGVANITTTKQLIRDRDALCLCARFLTRSRVRCHRRSEIIIQSTIRRSSNHALKMREIPSNLQHNELSEGKKESRSISS